MDGASATALACFATAFGNVSALAPSLLAGTSSIFRSRPQRVEFILNMGIDYGGKIGVRLKSKAFCPRRIEIARPSRDDPDDRLIGIAADEGDGLVAGDGAQRLDLLPNGDAHAGQIERAASAQEREIELRRPQEELDRGSRRGVPMTDVLADRKDGFLARQGLADDAGEEPGSRLVGQSGTNADRGQAEANAVEEPAPRIVSEPKLADRLLGSVAGQRSGEKFVADLVGKRRAIDRDRGGEDQARLVGAAGQSLLAPDRLEDRVGSPEVDGVAFVEIRLRFARDHRRQQENDVRPRRDKFGRHVGGGDVEGVEGNREGRIRWRLRRDDVDKMRVRDGFAGEFSVADQARRQLAPDHARRADNKHLHSNFLLIAATPFLFAGWPQSKSVFRSCIFPAICQIEQSIVKPENNNALFWPHTISRGAW